MKKFFLFALLLLSGVCCGCGDDDDPVTQNVAKDLAGSWVGPMNCRVMNTDIPFENYLVTITPVSDDAVNIVLSSFTYDVMHLTIPDIPVKNVPVTYGGTTTTYSLQETNYSGKDALGKNFTGVLRGTMKDGHLSLQYTLQYGSMPMPMNITLEADRK